MIPGLPTIGAMTDLGFGLGNMLGQQLKDNTDEEERKRRMGLSTTGIGQLNFGMTGVASADLGMGVAGAGRR